jgi:general stress protein 26
MRPAFFYRDELRPRLSRPASGYSAQASFGMSSAHPKAMTASKKIDDLYDLIKGIETAMFTTRGPTGLLVSRPMATQDRIEGTDLWFVTNTDTHKLDDLALDPHVNCSYYNNRTHEWVSVAGIAHVSKNKNKVRQLYQENWKAWFDDEGGERDGGPNDPRLALIMVEAELATYMKVNKSRPIILFEAIRSKVTGSTPRLGDVREISGAELMD